MSRVTRVAVLAAAAITFIFLLSLHSLFDTVPSPLNSPTDGTDSRKGSHAESPVTKTRDSKRLVVASLKSEDTSWIARRLPSWPVSRYIVDDATAELTVPVKKGRESMVYLTYIVDSYSNLPDVSVFIHSTQYQWHNDDPNKDGGTVLQRLKLEHVRKVGYANLRCAWVIGCPSEIHVNSPKYDFPTEVSFRQGLEELFPEMKEKNSTPDVVGVSCCAQFAVTREKIMEKPRAEYERIRKWLAETKLEDSVSGRIMEYSWHMIFGMPAVHCPDVRKCYCDTFGLCDLPDCKENECPTQYQLPPFSTMPEGWEQMHEFDDPVGATAYPRVQLEPTSKPKGKTTDL